LCISTFYFHEVACVLAWWLLTSLLALMAMLVAGGRYILQMVGGKPVPQRARVAANLTERWWDSLSPKMIVTRGKNDRREADFLSSLYPHLGDDWLAVHNLTFTTQNSAQVADLILLGPSGLWIFICADWVGTIVRQDGSWLQMHKRRKQVISSEQPDNSWNQAKAAIETAIEAHLPHLAWIPSRIQGGIVFTNRKASLDTSEIEGNSAPYGLPSAWKEKLIQSPPDERLTLAVLLEIVDVLFTMNGAPNSAAGVFSSARDEADHLYKLVADQLRDHVTSLVNK